MNADQARQPKGTPTGGQFAAGTRGEADVRLGDPGPSALEPFTVAGPRGPVHLQMPDGVDPRTAGLPPVRPADWDPFDNALDRTVDSVLTGKLSRGMSGRDQASALRSWLLWAERTAERHRAQGDLDGARAFDDFTAGMQHAVVALMSDKAEVVRGYVISRVSFDMGHAPRPGDFWAAQRLVTQKRTSRASRAEWQSKVQHAASAATQRGYVTAGLVLSGLDDWWGLREDPTRTVLGGAERDVPHTTGA